MKSRIYGGALAVLGLSAWLLGCTAIAPAVMTYTSPSAQPIAHYESTEQIGAWARMNEDTIELFLPEAPASNGLPGRIICTRDKAQAKLWDCSRATNPANANQPIEISLEVAQSEATVKYTPLKGPPREFHIEPGMLVITLAGNKHIWLTRSGGVEYHVLMVFRWEISPNDPR